jgi:hypothetical protein
LSSMAYCKLRFQIDFKNRPLGSNVFSSASENKGFGFKPLSSSWNFLFTRVIFFQYLLHLDM